MSGRLQSAKNHPAQEAAFWTEPLHLVLHRPRNVSNSSSSDGSGSSSDCSDNDAGEIWRRGPPGSASHPCGATVLSQDSPAATPPEVNQHQLCCNHLFVFEIRLCKIISAPFD